MAFTLEDRMDDVRTVVDAAGASRAVLVGTSEGGPTCALFAATCPERTSSLVMIGSYARRIRTADDPWGASPDDCARLVRRMEDDRGTAIDLAAPAPRR